MRKKLLFVLVAVLLTGMILSNVSAGIGLGPCECDDSVDIDGDGICDICGCCIPDCDGDGDGIPDRIRNRDGSSED